MTGFHEETIRRAAESGALRGFKPGGTPRARWRFRVEDVEAWLAGGT